MNRRALVPVFALAWLAITVPAARRLAEADPAVAAGRLEVEVMTWYTQKGALAFPLFEELSASDGPED